MEIGHRLVNPTNMNISAFIDHTILRPDCIAEDIKKVCFEAIEHRFFSVCVPPYYVREAARILEDKPVKVATVIGFPMGYDPTAAKVEAIKRAIDDGADELDVVINICAVKNRQWNFVRNDIDSMTTAAHIKGKIIKVIIETGMLTEEEIRKVCELCLEIKPDFVKTSTGYNVEGASVFAVRLLREILGDAIRIKASGGIRDRETALQMIEAGAKRLGSSSGVKIVSG